MDVTRGISGPARSPVVPPGPPGSRSAGAAYKPSASIVVGSHNRLGCLCELLERFLAQDFTDFEVIVIEQSTVSTAEQRGRLAELASDPRIRIYPRSPLGGAGARNEGCRLARADIIVAFDDDDLPASHAWLSTLLRNFDDPRCLGVSGRHILENGPNPPYANMARARQRVLSYSPLMWQRCFPRSDVRSHKIENLMGGNSAVRRSVLERCGLWDAFTRCENENSLWFRLRRKLRPGEYLVFDPQATMIRRLDVEGGMAKRKLGVFAFGWAMFEYFHKIIGYYHPVRFVGLYPIYFGFFFWVICTWTWNESAKYRGKHARALATLAGFFLLQPVSWTVWLARLALDRLRRGPEKRETEFAPYPDAVICDELTFAA
ncbi:MAG: glycosyltransferase family 2 protein [Deltaproteobacteria bacterium]|nr:MAG: glycosyltransferase family 2 protein [Deltaproteobacteria bacterium]